jgi:pyrroloquinoline quinone biosynthesis protein D
MDLNAIPQFSSGCRLHPQQEVLLIPEGVLNLEGPARDILSLVDGKRSVSTIIEGLSEVYADADRAEIQNGVLNLLDRLQQRGLIRASIAENA